MGVISKAFPGSSGYVNVETGWSGKGPEATSVYIRSGEERGSGWAVGLTPDAALALAGAILQARADMLAKFGGNDG